MRRSGFTLIEFLITSIITAFILVTAVGSQRAISQSRGKIDNFTEANAELRYISGMIKKDLANIYRSGDKKEMKCLSVLKSLEQCEAMGICFYALRHQNIRPGKPESEIYEIEYYLEQREDKAYLMKRVQPNPYKLKNEGGILSIISEDVVFFSVRYYDKKEAEWLEEWPKNKALPPLIEIDIAIKTANSNKVIYETILVDFPRMPAKIKNNNNSGRDNETPRSRERK